MEALTGPELPALRKILGNASEIGAYVDPAALRELLEKVPPRQRDSIAIWTSHVLRLAAAEVWLRSQEDPSLPQRLLEDQRMLVP